MSSAVTSDNLIAPPQAVVARKPRVVFLDVIRGLAALCVLIQHTTEESTTFDLTHRPYLFWSFRWFNLGRVGVAAFFLVSGFVIPYSLERANSLRVFWVSRFFRLYPLFWFSIGVVLVYRLCGNDEMMREYTSHWRTTLLVNITMLEEFVVFHHLHFPPAIGLYWTLTLELVFYFIFSAFFALRINKRTLLFAWISNAAMFAAGLYEAHKHIKLPVGQMGLLAFAFLGTAVFRYYSGVIRKEQLALLAVGAAIAFAMAFGFGFRPPALTEDFKDEWSSVSMFTSYAGAAVLFAAMFMFRAREFPFPLRWLGMISYSVYLLHYPVWLALMRIPHHGMLSAPAWQLLVLAITSVVASITYLLIEKPGVELGKRLLGKPKPPTELGQVVQGMSPIGPVQVVPQD